ncbi:MAG: tetratricopeptide repeat protein [Pseudomonadota bacterium]
MIEKKSFKFLIVDDKPNMRRTIKNMLRQLGYIKFEEADDGNRALEFLRLAQFNFVISDWRMPKMDGVRLLQEIRKDESLQHIPFLLVTSEVEETTVAQALEIGPEGYITKPFGLGVLQKKIASIMDQRERQDSIEIKYQNGISLLNTKEYEQAQQVFFDILQISPNSPRVYYALGLVCEAKNDIAGAQSRYEKAIELSPQFIKAHERLAKIYLKSGDNEKAIQYMENASYISPKNTDRHMRIGKLHLKMGQPEKAKQAFQAIATIEPDNAEKLCEIGEVYLAEGYSLEAGEAFQSSLGINSENIHVYNRFAISLRKQGKYDEAIKQYKKALSIDPENEYVHFNLGRAYQEWGNKEEAIKFFQKALELYEGFPEAKAALKELGVTQPPDLP